MTIKRARDSRLERQRLDAGGRADLRWPGAPRMPKRRRLARLSGADRPRRRQSRANPAAPVPSPSCKPGKPSSFRRKPRDQRPARAIPDLSVFENIPIALSRKGGMIVIAHVNRLSRRVVGVAVVADGDQVIETVRRPRLRNRFGPVEGGLVPLVERQRPAARPGQVVRQRAESNLVRAI